MEREDLQAAWVRQAQLEAERGVITCRMCRRPAPLDEAVTVWRNGTLVFAVCDGCSSSHDLMMRPTDAGLEVRIRCTDPVWPEA